MIQLSNIEFQYPHSDFRLAFDELSFKDASKSAIIGPSGFGKTTLLNLISGIYIPQQGSVEVNNVQVHQLSESDRRTHRITSIGFVFQDFKLLEYLKVLDNILLPYRINKAMKMQPSLSEKARNLAKKLGIEDKLNKYPNKLSQGERQRVAICRALMNDPKVVLADEPTGNLDPENKQTIMDLLFEFVEDNGAMLITVTHDHELLSGFETVIDFKDLYKGK